MSSSPATTEPTAPPSEACDDLDRALAAGGPSALLDELVTSLDRRGEHRALLDALLLKARHELGLPLLWAGSLHDLPEPARREYEERYIAAIRRVGRKVLDAGDIASAWPYFRALGENEPIAEAIEQYEPEEGDPQVGGLIEVAFNQGANPRKGFELILRHYGTCSAITAFEHLPREGTVRPECAAALTRQLHEHLAANLRADIAQRGQAAPPESSPIPALLEGRDWLFGDDAYHIDVSHLASTVRMSTMLADPEALRLAHELTEYGRRLSGRHIYEGDPPFENLYHDHGVYLNALLGRDVEAALAHFRAKLEPAEAAEGEEGERPDPTAAQVFVGLLDRLGRYDEAIEVVDTHLSEYPEASLFCPGLARLCQKAGLPDRLARSARSRGELVHYAAGLIGSSRASAPSQ